MATNEIELKVKVNSETGQLEIVSQQLSKTGDAAKKVEGSFSSLSKGAVALAKSFLPFATVGGAIAFFTAAVKGAEEENEALRRLQFTIESTGQSWEKSKLRINEWTQEIQKATRFSDTEALETLDKLARATGSVAQAQAAATLAMNLKVVSQKSLAETTQLVNDLITKQERAVKMATKEYSAFIGEARDAQGILDNLAESTADAALKEEGLTKETLALKNNISEISDIIGNKLIPFLTTATGNLKDMAIWAQSAGEYISGFGKMLVAALTFDVKKGMGAFVDVMKEVTKESKNTENIKTDIAKSGSQDRIEVSQRETDEQIRERERLAEEEKRIAEKEKAARDREAEEIATHSQHLEEMETELQLKLQSLSADTFQKKLDLLRAEEVAEINAINKTKASADSKEKAVTATKNLYTKRREVETKEEAKLNTETSLQVAGIAIDALQTLNSMSELKSKNDARRAKMLLALEQSIAIARLWAAESSKGVAGIAIAAAGTALIVAQFAQQSQAIDRAVREGGQTTTSTFTQTDIGGGTDIVTETGGNIGVGVGIGGGTSGASYGGGGGGSTFINVGGVVIQFTADHVDLSNIDSVCRSIADAARRGTIEAVQMAVSVARAAEKNTGLAV